MVCVHWVDVEGEVDVDVEAIVFERCSKILACAEGLGDEYRRVVAGDVAFIEVPSESIAAFTEVPPEFAEPEFAEPEFAEFSVSSIFLVLRLSSADSWDERSWDRREPNCNDLASGPLTASGSLLARPPI
jgi:hypothetical protein